MRQMRLLGVDVSLGAGVEEVDPGFSAFSSRVTIVDVPSFRGNCGTQGLQIGHLDRILHSSNNYSVHHFCCVTLRLLWL